MKDKTFAIVVGAIILSVISLLWWQFSGHAFCSWYNFDMNTSLQRQIMETCIT